MQEHLLQTPVAELVRREFVAVRPEQTLDEALGSLRQSKPSHRIVYFYVLDSDGVLVGILPTRRLLMGDPAAKVGDLMLKRFIAVPGQLFLLEACEFFILHRLLALPVVAPDGKLLGVIDVDQFAEGLTELGAEAGLEIEEEDHFWSRSAEVFQLIGLRIASYRKASFVEQIRGRFLWLLCNVAGGLAAAVIVALFQSTLDRAIALAMFIPVVLALAESVSIQSLTIALRDTHHLDLASVFRREMPVGLTLGILCGACLAVVVGLWTQDARLVVVLMGTMMISLTWAAVLGRSVPVVIGTGGRDPKVASGPLVLTLTDLGTLACYLLLATFLV